MSSFQPVTKLNVWRRLSDGRQVLVGAIAQNRHSVFFQYNDHYLHQYSNISPFKLNFDQHVQPAPAQPHNGLHGVFADSLPDGWGHLLMDRVFRQHGILPNQVTAMDRLAYIGYGGIGALAFEPVCDYQPKYENMEMSISELGLQAQAVFNGETVEVLAQLAKAGSSGGARPKALVYFPSDNDIICSTIPQPHFSPWIVKFTSQQLALGHEEGVCEAAYLTLAKQAGIIVPEWRLIPAPETSGASAWLALKRFDCSQQGRYHLHSLCGLLDADFRLPSMDYADLIKASCLLCKSPMVGHSQFRRAIFNLFSLNQDDHTKNWAFLQDDIGGWTLAPFYDVTFSPNPYNEHATAFNGFGKMPSLKAMQQLAKQANFARWQDAQIVIDEVVTAISNWDNVAHDLGVKRETQQLISVQLSQVREQNKQLLSG